MLANAVPDTLDSSAFHSFSGAVKSQMMVALRSTGLITADGDTTPALRQLANAADERPAALRPIIESTYAAILALAASNATPAQFEAAMRQVAGSGDTYNKAVTFFVAAAQ